MNARAAEPMKMWLSAAEIAALGLPGLPGTRENVARLATQEGWSANTSLARIRNGRLGGGVYEYHVDLLPVAARAAYVARHVRAVNLPAALLAEAEAEPGADRLAGRAAEARDARLALIAAADRYARDARLTVKTADRHFSDLYNTGRIEVADWIRAEIASVSPRTLARWRAARAKGETQALGVDRGASRRGTGILDRAADGAVKILILALVAARPHLTAHHIRAVVAERFPGLDLPPVRTFQHALKAWKTTHKVELTAIADPDGFRARYALSGRNAMAHVRRPNQLWMIDASPADVMLTDGRHSVYVAIDIFTRRMMVYVTKTPRSEAVQLLLRRALLAWGLPEAVKTDNGSDFVASATSRLFAALDIEAIKSIAFSPQEKGHVERAIGTLQRDLMRTLPGFVGHSVADRKVIENRRSFAKRLGEDPRDVFSVELTAEDLQRRCDAWATTAYAHRPHAGLGGATPFQVTAAAAEPVRKVDERALDVLLMPAAGRDGLRVATKYGIRIDHRTYLAPHILPETQVLVRMDPADLGRAYLFATDAAGAYLGVAICPEVAGIDPKAAVAAAKAEQKRVIDDGTREIRRQAKAIGRGAQIADLVAAHAARQAGNVVAFPAREETHSTPAIAAAIEASRPFEPARPAMPADVAAIHAEMVAEFEALGEAAGATAGRAVLRPEPTNVVALPETPKHRFRRAVEIERRLAAGERVATDEAIWFGGYRTSSEFLAHRDLHEVYGDEWLFA